MGEINQMEPDLMPEAVAEDVEDIFWKVSQWYLKF